MEPINHNHGSIGLANVDAATNIMVVQLAALDLNGKGSGSDSDKEGKRIWTVSISLNALMIPLWRE